VTAARRLLPPPPIPTTLPPSPPTTRERLRGRRASRLAPPGRRLCFKSRLSARHAANHDAWHVRARAITERVDGSPPLFLHLRTFLLSLSTGASRRQVWFCARRVVRRVARVVITCAARTHARPGVGVGISQSRSQSVAVGRSQSVRVRHVLSPAWPGPRLPFLLLPPLRPQRTAVERFTAAFAFQKRTPDRTNERTGRANDCRLLRRLHLSASAGSCPSRPGWCCGPPHRDPAAGHPPGCTFPQSPSLRPAWTRLLAIRARVSSSPVERGKAGALLQCPRLGNTSSSGIFSLACSAQSRASSSGKRLRCFSFEPLPPQRTHHAPKEDARMSRK